MRYIFLSYNPRDLAIMDRIAQILNNHGIKVYTDLTFTVNSPQWKDEINRVMRGAVAVGILMSPYAKASPWSSQEMVYLQTQGLPLFPLLVRGNQESSIPPELINSQWLDMTSDEKFSTSMTLLIASLHSHLNSQSELSYQELHLTLKQIAEHFLNLSWISLITIGDMGGQNIGFYGLHPHGSSSQGEDKVGPISSAHLYFSERIATEFEIGGLRFAVQSGATGMIFTIPISSDLMLTFKVQHANSVDAILRRLHDVYPLIQKLIAIR